MTHTVLVEVGPLQELRYSGIRNVTLNLCRYWLRQHVEASRFFLRPYLIDRSSIEAVVAVRSGGLFPEAGGNAACYFDPTSLPSVEQTLLSALRRLPLERASLRAASQRAKPKVSPGTISPAGSIGKSLEWSQKMPRETGVEYRRDYRLSTAARQSTI